LRTWSTWLLGGAALLSATGIFLAVRFHYLCFSTRERRPSHFYFRELGSASYGTAGRRLSIFRPEVGAPLALQEWDDQGRTQSCLTHSLHEMSIDVGDTVSQAEAERLMKRGVRGNLSIMGSGGDLSWDVLLVASEPPTSFLLAKGVLRPLRINTPLADVLLRGCDAFHGGAPVAR